VVKVLEASPREAEREIAHLIAATLPESDPT
jgi:hypothetical protein